VFLKTDGVVPESINQTFSAKEFTTEEYTLTIDMAKLFEQQGIEATYSTNGKKWWYVSLDNYKVDGTDEEKLESFWNTLVSCMDEASQQFVAQTGYRAYVVKSETVGPHMDGIKVEVKVTPSTDTTPDTGNTGAGTTPATGVTPVTTVTDTTTPATTPSTTVADTTATDTTVTPAEVTEITDGDVPLAAADDVADVDLEDEDVPLAATPDTEDTTILDEATPLADGADATEVAKTGDSILLYAFFSVLGLAGIITVTAFGRKRAR
jgi:hypothetical protein